MKTRFYDNGRSPVSAYLTGITALAVAALALWLADSASADIYAQYTFNDGTANDSSGNGFNGTLVDPQGTAGFVGGAVNLTNNNGIASNQAQNGAYVDLPNNLLSNAADAGVLYDASLEIWFTEEQHRTWARLFDLGASEGGEDVSDSGGSTDYVLAVSGTFDSGAAEKFAGETHYGGTSGSTNGTVAGGTRVPPTAMAPTPLTTGVQHQVVLTLAQNGTSGSTGAPHEDGDPSTDMDGDNGIATIYVDGVSVGSTPIIDGFYFNQMDNNNNWLGRSQYGGDQLFDGVFDQFTIYDNALSANDVSTSFAAGPIEVPFPSLVIDRGTGEISIHNDTSGPINLTGYSVQSADGALNISSWDSVAPASGWSRTGPQNSTDASENGGTAQVLAAGGSLSLGSLWLQSPTEDVSFNFTTTGASGAGAISYTGDVLQRSDFNGDGSINAADWSIFLANNAQPLGVSTPVAAYLKGDLNGDLTNNFQDYILFKQDYIAANGAPAFAALAGVPEPSALALCGLAGVLGLLRRRRSC